MRQLPKRLEAIIDDVRPIDWVQSYPFDWDQVDEATKDVASIVLGNYAEKLRPRFGSLGDIGQNAANTPRDYRTLRLELAPDLCDSFGR